VDLGLLRTAHVQNEGKNLRRRLKNEIGRKITAEEYSAWSAAKDKKGRLNSGSNPETRKMVIDTEGQLRHELISRLPVIEQVAAFVSGTNDTVVGISDQMVVQTDMLGYPNKGHPGKGTEGVNSVFMKI
jgi:hypothetical protein